MRPVALLGIGMIAGAAGLMAYLWITGGDCPDGAIYRNLDMCRDGGRTAERCNQIMAEANQMLARSGPVHNTREQCEERFVTCQGSIGATGFVPRATGFCIRRGPPETIVPLFGPRGGG